MSNRVKNSHQLQDNTEALKAKTQKMKEEWKKKIINDENNYKEKLK